MSANFVSTIDNMDLHLKDLNVSTRGVKSALVVTAEDTQLFYTFEDFTHTPFGPSSFDKDPQASRMQLDVRISGEAETFFESIDQWAITYLSENSERFFKKKFTCEQISERYHPCLRKSEKHPTLLKTKINLHGNRACQFWSSDGELVACPENWKNIDFRLKVNVSHLWMMGNDCGLVINSTDVLMHERAICAFPF